MGIKILTPELPESVADATIVAWHKEVGEHVTRDENLVDLETDKVVLEVPAQVSGVITEINHEVGAVVTSGEVLGILSENAVAVEQSKPEKTAVEPPVLAATSAEKRQTENMVATENTATDKVQVMHPPHASPSARQKMFEQGVSQENVIPGGSKGRILPEDIDRAAVQQKSSAGVPIVAMGHGEREEQRVPMTRLRARIAERLQQIQNTAAILTTFNEIDMSAVMSLRSQYKADFEKSHGVKLGFMSFFARASVEALKRYPEANASIEGTDIIYHGYYDIGVAVSSSRGLVVPVLRNVDTLSMASIEKHIIDYGQRARQGSLGMDELTGGTFTLSNGGVFGSLLSTPIINPPQCAILGMHKIEKRAVVINDEIVIRPMMYVALSYDHRLIDGKQAVGFLNSIKSSIEEPAKILLDL